MEFDKILAIVNEYGGYEDDIDIYFVEKIKVDNPSVSFKSFSFVDPNDKKEVIIKLVDYKDPFFEFNFRVLFETVQNYAKEYVIAKTVIFPNQDRFLIESDQDIVGRGRVITVDVSRKDNWIDELPIKVSDQIEYQNKTFTVIGIESKKNLLDSKICSLIGLVIKQNE